MESIHYYFWNTDNLFLSGWESKIKTNIVFIKRLKIIFCYVETP